MTCFTWRWIGGLWRSDQLPGCWRWLPTATGTALHPTGLAPSSSASSWASCGRTLPVAPWLSSKSTLFCFLFCFAVYPLHTVYSSLWKVLGDAFIEKNPISNLHLTSLHLLDHQLTTTTSSFCKFCWTVLILSLSSPIYFLTLHVNPLTKIK